MTHRFAFRAWPSVFVAVLAWLILTGPGYAQQRRIPSPTPPSANDDPTAETETPDPETDPDPNAPTTEESEAEGPEAQQSTTLWGDPQRFNQYSGWGGIGGAMGQWGMARSMLVMMPAVQEELGMTDEQKTRLREWTEEMRDRGQEMARSMREESREGFRQGNFNLQGIMGMMTFMTQLLKENEQGMARILDPEQRRRLNQIALQMEGVTALARPEVAKAVRLQPFQHEQIQQVLAQTRTRQIVHWIGQTRQMWGNRGGPPGRPDGPNPGRNQPGAERTERPQASTAEQREQTRQQFETMRSGADQIQEATVVRILKVLTRRQRASYDRLLGEPFDPTQLNVRMEDNPRAANPTEGSSDQSNEQPD